MFDFAWKEGTKAPPDALAGTGYRLLAVEEPQSLRLSVFVMRLSASLLASHRPVRVVGAVQQVVGGYAVVVGKGDQVLDRGPRSA